VTPATGSIDPTDHEGDAADGETNGDSAPTEVRDIERKARVNEIIARAMARRAAKSSPPPPAAVGTGNADDTTEAAPPDEADPTPAPSAPVSQAVVLIASNRYEARYLRQPGIELDLIVTGRCAVEVRADGDALYEDTLYAGDSIELPSSGSVWIRLDDPHAATVNAEGVALLMAMPAESTPYSLVFDVAEQQHHHRRADAT
jgi:hypothetical protein